MELILASGSPRRRELLSLYTTDFTVCVSDFDESTVTADTPAHLVEQLARGKCLAVAKDHPDAVVIGCDTVVDVNGEVFGKPHGVEDAKRMLRALSGSAHQVHTGVCVSRGGRTESFVDSCGWRHTAGASGLRRRCGSRTAVFHSRGPAGCGHPSICPRHCSNAAPRSGRHSSRWGRWTASSRRAAGAPGSGCIRWKVRSRHHTGCTAAGPER